MKGIFSFIIALIGWFAVISQFWLMMTNRTADISETIVRFFSFFTILTNLLVAIYFSIDVISSHKKRSGSLTAITTYIFIVGLIYQLILRSTWHPEGFQKVVDELLHSVNPLLVLIFWYQYENKKGLSYTFIPKWLTYPLLYLIYVLIRGHFSHFYPYPFINVNEIGMQQVLMNAVGITFLFIIVSAALILIGKLTAKRESKSL